MFPSGNSVSTMAIVKAGSTLEKGLRPFPTHECTNVLYCPTSFKIIFKFKRQVINPKLVKNKKNIKDCPKVGYTRTYLKDYSNVS